MFSKWAYILIGDNNTGKTSFQKFLIEALCQKPYKRRQTCNVVMDIIHPRAPKNLKTLFTANRSYQEKQKEYRNPKNYFKHFFEDADICILSSHSHGSSIKDVQAMIDELNLLAYNVAGVFWSNKYDSDAKKISALPWQERLWIENPLLKSDNLIDIQIKRLAYDFSEMLVTRAYTK